MANLHLRGIKYYKHSNRLQLLLSVALLSQPGYWLELEGETAQFRRRRPGSAMTRRRSADLRPRSATQAASPGTIRNTVVNKSIIKYKYLRYSSAYNGRLAGGWAIESLTVPSPWYYPFFFMPPSITAACLSGLYH
jgi:hypothetical protein